MCERNARSQPVIEGAAGADGKVEAEKADKVRGEKEERDRSYSDFDLLIDLCKYKRLPAIELMVIYVRYSCLLDVN